MKKRGGITVALPGCISIDELAVRCIIGTREIERVNRQKVIISLRLECDLAAAAASDSLADTVNYKKLVEDISAMVEGSSFFLLERLAGRIADICMMDSRVKSAYVKVSKPGALARAGMVSVEICRSRT